VWISQEFVRGLERFDAQAHGAHKCAESKPDCLVVIDNVDDGTVGCRRFSRHSVVTSRSREAVASPPK
jgi:hypothetical protein